MADSASAVLGTASLPPTDALERAASFTGEPFVFEGEDLAAALSPGTPRRRALDAALAELEAGAEVPSVQWRRDWSLLLGLDRVLSQDEPHLVDGTVLSAHQVDALSGTLTALLAEVERQDGAPVPAAPVDEESALLASAGIPGEAELPQELQEDEGDEEPQDWTDEDPEVSDDEQLAEQPEDPNAGKRFWFEHATGAGKTVAALGFVESSQTGGVLILTHRRNLVDQFHGELKDRGYSRRITPPLLRGQDSAAGPVTVETYQWFVRNAGNVSDAYTIVICDEAHTALGEKTSAAIRAWGGPVFIGMTATGALIARHVTDLFPTQTSRFDLAQAARRGVISPLRCVRIPPGPGVRTIAKVPLRRGEVDVEFDQEMLAELLDQQPFNVAIADLYKTRFDGVPGVVYTAGVRHAHNVAEAFRELGLKARAVSGETPKRELAQILAAYERGDIDVLVNAQLLAEGWNSPRATICLHLAPTASKRIYQQRVGRVTRRHPGKEAGIVVDFVHPATKHDDPVVTLHSLLDRDVYRGGAIVVGPVRRGRGRRLRVERRVVPVTADGNRRIEVFERELWRIAVEHLDWGEQVQWAALAGARVTLTGWRRARAMLHFDTGGELKRTFLVTAVQRNKNAQVRLKALQEIAAARDADAFDAAVEVIGNWPRDERREGVKVALQALAEKKLGRRDQANNWIWRCAEYTLDVHEEYAVQRWPETKRLLGLLVNSAAGTHARNARRLVHAARDQDRRLQAALLAAAVPHTAEAGEVINGARARLARKPPSLARELLKNFPKPKAKKSRRRRRKGAGEAGETAEDQVLAMVAVDAGEAVDVASGDGTAEAPTAATEVDAAEGAAAETSAETSTSTRRSGRRRRGRRRSRRGEAVEGSVTAGSDGVGAEGDAGNAGNAGGDDLAEPAVVADAVPQGDEAVGTAGGDEAEPRAKPRRTRRTRAVAAAAASEEAAEAVATPDSVEERASAPDGEAGDAAVSDQADAATSGATADAEAAEITVPASTPRRTRKAPASEDVGEDADAGTKVASPRRRTKAAAAGEADAVAAKRHRRSRKAAEADEVAATTEPGIAAPTAQAPTAAGARAEQSATMAADTATPKRTRRTRKTAVGETQADAAAAAAEAGTGELTRDAGSAASPASGSASPARTTRRRSAGVPAATEPGTGEDESPAPPKQPRHTRKAATTEPAAESAAASPRSDRAAAESSSGDATGGSAATDADTKAKPIRRTRRPVAIDETEPPTTNDAAAATPDGTTKPPARARRTTTRKTTAAEAQAREAAAADVIAAAPRRARTTRRKAPTPVDLPDAVQRASETVQDAVRRKAQGDDQATDAAA